MNWNDLSIKEKSDIMKVAISNGITNLNDIKARYNEFAEGGNLYGDGGDENNTKTVGLDDNGVYHLPWEIKESPTVYDGSSANNNNLFNYVFTPEFKTVPSYIPEQFVNRVEEIPIMTTEDEDTLYVPANHIPPSEQKKNDIRKAINYAFDYYYSPGFNERLKNLQNLGIPDFKRGNFFNNSGWGTNLYKKREYPFNNNHPKNKGVTVNYAAFDTGASYIQRPTDWFEFGNDSMLKKTKADWSTIAAHEAGHMIDSYLSPIYDRGSYSRAFPIFKKTKSTDYKHDAKPEESYADLFSLRNALFELGIYDSRETTPFTYEHLKKFKESGKYNRLLENFSDNDIIWMMNNVAQSNNSYNGTDESENNISALGGPLVQAANRFDLGGYEDTEDRFNRHLEELSDVYPLWLNGMTVTPNGNRETTYEDWRWANAYNDLKEREANAANSVRNTGNEFIVKPIGNALSKVGDVLDTPIMVQATPGTATAYSSFGQYMPTSESTIGNQLDLLATTLSAPLDVSGVYSGIKSIPKVVDYGLARLGNKAAKSRTLARELDNALVAEGISGTDLSWSDNTGLDLKNRFLRMRAEDFMKGNNVDNQDLKFLYLGPPSSWTIQKRPFSDGIVKEINNTARPRILAQLEKDARLDFEPGLYGNDIEDYVNKALNYTNKQIDDYIDKGYYLGSDDLFKAYDVGKTKTRTGGVQFNDDSRIVLRDMPDINHDKFAVHEWEHRRTNPNVGGSYYGNEEELLSDAYNKEFIKLSETVPDFKGYKMKSERVTTNSDARAQLLGKYHAQNTDWKLQNKIIDTSSDEKIFEAVEKANAYGKYYIERLRELNELTPELAKAMREAMKWVGVSTGLGVSAIPLINDNSQ